MAQDAQPDGVNSEKFKQATNQTEREHGFILRYLMVQLMLDVTGETAQVVLKNQYAKLCNVGSAALTMRLLTSVCLHIDRPGNESNQGRLENSLTRLATRHRWLPTEIDYPNRFEFLDDEGVKELLRALPGSKRLRIFLKENTIFLQKIFPNKVKTAVVRSYFHSMFKSMEGDGVAKPGLLADQEEPQITKALKLMRPYLSDYKPTAGSSGTQSLKSPGIQG